MNVVLLCVYGESFVTIDMRLGHTDNGKKHSVLFCNYDVVVISMYLSKI